MKNILLIIVLLLQISVYARDGGKHTLQEQSFSFRENKRQVRDRQGKTRADIDFIMQTRDLTLYIGKGQLHYQFTKAEPADTTTYSKANPPKSYHVSGAVAIYRLDVNLVNSNKNAVVLPEEPVKERYYYYNNSGSNAEGVNDVRAYKKIVYKNVYPNIDWVLYTNGKGLKYDFVVHPGGKSSDIQLKYDGATSIKLTMDGSLNIATPLGSLTEETPYSYEAESKKTITSKFVLKDNIVSFKTGTYKSTLVIDPGVKWAPYFGGTSAEGATNIVVDNSGYTYISSVTQSNTNITTTGAHQIARGGGYNDGFLAKWNMHGPLEWATYYGGGTGSPLSGAKPSVAAKTKGNIDLREYTIVNIPGQVIQKGD